MGFGFARVRIKGIQISERSTVLDSPPVVCFSSQFSKIQDTLVRSVTFLADLKKKTTTRKWVHFNDIICEISIYSFMKDKFIMVFRYRTTIADNGYLATVECNPELGGVIDSHNVTVVLGRHGNSLVRLQDNIVSLDNKLRPYHFQTHAGNVLLFK